MKYNFGLDGDIGGWVYTKEYVRWKLQGMEGKPVTVRINSLGGRVDHALAIAQQFRDHGDVTCVIVGMCASAATIVCMGAAKVIMDSNALFLAHKCRNLVSSWDMMNADEIRDFISKLEKNAQDNETIDRVIATMYANKSGLPIDRVLEVMKKGAWLDADHVGQLKLVDEVRSVGGEKTNAKENFAQVQVAYGLPDLPEGKKWYQPLVNLFGRDVPVAEEPVDDPENNNPAPSAAEDGNKSNQTNQSSNIMKKTFKFVCALLAIEAINIAEGKANEITEQQMDAIEGELARLNAEAEKVPGLEQQKKDLEQQIATLTAQVNALKQAPGDKSPGVHTEGQGTVDYNDDATAARLASELVDSLR